MFEKFRRRRKIDQAIPLRTMPFGRLRVAFLDDLNEKEIMLSKVIERAYLGKGEMPVYAEDLRRQYQAIQEELKSGDWDVVSKLNTIYTTDTAETILKLLPPIKQTISNEEFFNAVR